MKLSNLKPRQPYKPRPWKWVTAMLPLIAIVLIVLFGALVISSLLRSFLVDEPTCDKRCQSSGYPAGEVLVPTHFRHDVCVCWPKEPGPPGYFLLKRDE